jgi:trehalose 6-phosphate phosphatase
MAQSATEPFMTDGVRRLQAADARESRWHAAPPVDLLRGSSLFLDFDGTLVEIVERPDAVTVDAALTILMEKLALGLQGRLAIVSGRPRAEIDALFRARGFAVSGSHGLELRWADGRVVAPSTPVGLKEIVAEMRGLAASHPGTLVEEKPFGVALHYRGAPDAENDCRLLAERLAASSGLALQAGKMVFELRVPGADKGVALERFMREPPMRGTRPIFIGDDLTDEHAFAAAAAFGGDGILVGPARNTAARYHLADVEETRAWLTAAAEALA